MICVPPTLMLVFDTLHDELTELLPGFFCDVLHTPCTKGSSTKRKTRAFGLWGHSLQYSKA